MKNQAKLFWLRVIQEMHLQDISIKELSILAKINPSTITKGLKRQSIPNVIMGIRIARVLSVSLEYLLFGENRPAV